MDHTLKLPCRAVWQVGHGSNNQDSGNRMWNSSFNAKVFPEMQEYKLETRKNQQMREKENIITHRIMRGGTTGGSTAGNYRHNGAGEVNTRQVTGNYSYYNKTGRHNWTWAEAKSTQRRIEGLDWQDWNTEGPKYRCSHLKPIQKLMWRLCLILAQLHFSFIVCRDVACSDLQRRALNVL